MPAEEMFLELLMVDDLRRFSMSFMSFIALSQFLRIYVVGGAYLLLWYPMEVPLP